MWLHDRITWGPRLGPENDAGSGAPRAVPLTPPLPAVWAEGIARRLGGRRDTVTVSGAQRQADRLVRSLLWCTEAAPISVCEPEPASASALFWCDDDLKDVTAGRRLLSREVYRRLRRLKGRRAFSDDFVPGELAALTAALFRVAKAGWGRVQPGIVWDLDDTLRCARCGRDDVTPWPCSRCGHLCFECETCSSLGPIRSCDVLFEGGPLPAAPGSEMTAGERNSPPPSDRRISVRGLPFPLSPAQEAASRQVLSFLEGPQREALLWAACGAGKTEVAFSAMAAVLQRGDDVLFAVPRRDVAAELGRRLAEYVAPLPVDVAYGGAPFHGGDAGGKGGHQGRLPRLVVATTHQCVRWGSVFPFVVLDEADAFPYSHERFLRDALQRTVAPGGKLLTMTATPERDHLAAARRGRIALITIPARHHGHPLPVPRWCKVRVRGTAHRSAVSAGIAAGDDGVMRAISPLLHACAERGPTLIFVPTVKDAERVGAALARSFGGGRASPRTREGLGAASVHSADPRRDEHIEAFRSGQLPLLVTTAVLERGITVPSAQVVVLDADRDDIWDERALVQMAGRAGRSTSDPDGLVYFVSRRWNQSMVRAVAQIRELNVRAERGGFLKGKTP